MGSVWLADQPHPVQRQVALKLIKAGFGTPDLVARFEAERQALALMDHPHIARVLDAGMAEDGRPFFAMELVAGVPLTRFCDERRLGLRQRLGQFIQVCQAVQHAHHKGIIHRDLKPSNILVAEVDGQPFPKVIDFGVAKVTGPRLGPQSPQTETDALVGTLEYMSPEQARVNPVDIDTRTDVYSLGVILYELLSGSLPFEGRQAGLLELLRHIRDVDPPPPSARVTVRGTAQTVAQQRGNDPARLRRKLAGELDWIVGKALAKDRDHRYQTVSDLAADVERYLHNEPVLAGPPSATYRLRKFVQRNRTVVTAAAALVAVLVIGIIGTSWGMLWAFAAEQQAIDARDTAQRNENEADKQRKAAVEQSGQRKRAEDAANAEKEKALRKADEMLAILGFLQDHVLAASRPRAQHLGLGVNTTLQEAIDAAEPAIAVKFADKPIVEASVRNVLGLTYWYAGHPRKAVPQFERAFALQKEHLSVNHPDRLQTTSNLGLIYLETGRAPDGLLLLQGVLEIRRKELGPDHLHSLISLDNLAEGYRILRQFDKALELNEEAYRRMLAVLGPDDPDTLIAMQNLAEARDAAGHREDAMALRKEALQRLTAVHGPDHQNTLKCKANLASAYRDHGETAAAIDLLEDVTRRSKTALGAEHPDTMRSMMELAESYQQTGQPDRALPLVDQVIKTRQKRLGADHSLTSSAEVFAAYLRLRTGERDALQRLEETLARAGKVVGDSDIFMILAINELARTHQNQGKVDDAITLYERALKAVKTWGGPDRRELLTVMNNLGTAYTGKGRTKEAIALLEDTLKRRKALLGLRNDETLSTMYNLAEAYEDFGRFDDAIPLLEETLENISDLVGAEHQYTRMTRKALARVYQRAADAHEKAGQPADAAERYKKLLVLKRKELPADSLVLADYLLKLGQNLTAAARAAEAEPPLREGLAICEKQAPKQWGKYAAQVLLGGSLAGQKKYRDAEPLLLAGFEGLKGLAADLSPFARKVALDCAKKLADVYEALGDRETAKQWRQRSEQPLDPPTDRGSPRARGRMPLPSEQSGSIPDNPRILPGPGRFQVLLRTA
jgi:tetratricopeptide (TPR) repeat protein